MTHLLVTSNILSPLSLFALTSIYITLRPCQESEYVVQLQLVRSLQIYIILSYNSRNPKYFVPSISQSELVYLSLKALDSAARRHSHFGENPVNNEFRLIIIYSVVTLISITPNISQHSSFGLLRMYYINNWAIFGVWRQTDPIIYYIYPRK